MPAPQMRKEPQLRDAFLDLGTDLVERRDVDQSDWFPDVSPLWKTPVLLAAGEAVFESAVICKYLDDTEMPRLHPDDALQRATGGYLDVCERIGDFDLLSRRMRG